ncbi:unnamed protein product [Caenorhabditis nigoni]
MFHVAQCSFGYGPALNTEIQIETKRKIWVLFWNYQFFYELHNVIFPFQENGNCGDRSLDSWREEIISICGQDM